jgi:hypothetical protein
MRKTLRTLLAALFGIALAACSTLGSQALFGDSVAFTAPELQHQLDRRFPRDYDELGGLLQLRVLNPRVSIPPGDDRLRLDFDIALALPGQGDSDQDGDRPAGHIAVSSGLRWNTQTRGLHLDAPALESADVPQLGGAMNATGRDLVDRWLQDYARREPVYQFEAGLLQQIASRRIDATTITNGQVVVHLGQ